MVFKQTLERNFYACPYCNYCLPMPADVRLQHLFDSSPLTELDPLSIPKPLLESLQLTALVSRTAFPDSPCQLVAAGEGTISDYPTILVVVPPYVVLQRIHFVTLLIAIRTALQRKLPLITIYPSETFPKPRASDKPRQPELSPAEMTYLTIEMDGLAQARLPLLTVLTDADPTFGFSTRFPLGELVLAEQRTTPSNPSTQTLQPTQSDILIDLYVQRQDLPAMLGKLLAFFAKSE
jgi:acetyl-CoA carboxylase beta subunit